MATTRALFAFLAILIASVPLCAAAAPAAIAGPPPGRARIWIYRVFDPSVTLRAPEVRLNGTSIGPIRPGSALFLDVLPATYRVTADSQGSAPDQFATVGLAAGWTAFIRVDADNWWASANCNTAVLTFYTRLVGAPLAQADIASLRVAGGG